MPRTTHDSPYRDDSPSQAAPSRDKRSRPSRAPAQSRRARPESSKPQKSQKPQKPQAEPQAKAHARPHAEAPAKQQVKRPGARQPAHQAAAQEIGSAKSPRQRSGRRSRRGKGGAPQIQLTSHPTGRAAYAETRAWLLEQHGPVCAYCGVRFTPRVMTLDHVAPRRGQVAYDRRDNLVLACPGCNGAKRDLAPLAYLLGARSRAANLLRYGAHLSPMLLELARELAPDVAGAALPSANGATWPELDDDGESPYRD